MKHLYTVFIKLTLLLSALTLSTHANNELHKQYKVLESNIKNKKNINKFPEQAFNSAALIKESDRDPLDIVLRRTEALLAHLLTKTNKVEAFSQKLEEIKTSSSKTSISAKDRRYQLYVEMANLRREIAFSNPLLDFSQILFIKRHRAKYDHMCDQFYGVNAKSGGGLYILQNAFSEKPSVKNLLVNSTLAAYTKMLIGSEFFKI